MNEGVERIERVKKVIETLALNLTYGNKAELARKLGIGKQTVAAWGSRGTIDFEKVFNTFPEVSGDWLLSLGQEGSIFNSCRSRGNVTEIAGNRNSVNNSINNINNVRVTRSGAHTHTRVEGDNKGVIGGGSVTNQGGVSQNTLDNLVSLVTQLTQDNAGLRQRLDNAGL